MRFTAIYKRAVEMASTICVIPQRRRGLPRSSNIEAMHLQTIAEHFRLNLCLPFIDVTKEPRTSVVESSEPALVLESV